MSADKLTAPMSDAGFWKLTYGADGTLTVEPRSYLVYAGFSSLSIAGVTGAMLLVPGVEAGMRVIFAYLGVFIGVAMVCMFIAMHRAELRSGPYLVIGPESIQLRHGTVVPHSQFASFIIQRNWELYGDGKSKISRLTLACKTGEEIEVLGCPYHGQLVKLKNQLEASVAGFLAKAAAHARTGT